MEIIVNHTIPQIPKFKHSDMLGAASSASNTAYQILSQMGYDTGGVGLVALYIVTVLSGTGASVLEKWEKQEEEDKNGNVNGNPE